MSLVFFNIIVWSSEPPCVQTACQNSITRFFYKQPSCSGSNVKNSLKVKQLTGQPLTLKMLMPKFWLDSE